MFHKISTAIHVPQCVIINDGFAIEMTTLAGITDDLLY